MAMAFAPRSRATAGGELRIDGGNRGLFGCRCRPQACCAARQGICV